jgi:hypothetical protein
MSLLGITDGLPAWMQAMYAFGKVAAVDDPPQVAYNLAGTLQLSSSGWLLLSVPNALVRGIFDAMREPGIELPPSGTNEGLNAHVSVMKPREVTMLGGADKISERGQQFHYTLGRLYSVEPDGWPEMEKVWFCRIHSPALQELRRSYGLSSLPNDGKYDFHISVAVRRRGVLGRNEKTKVGS